MRDEGSNSETVPVEIALWTQVVSEEEMSKWCRENVLSFCLLRI